MTWLYSLKCMWFGVFPVCQVPGTWRSSGVTWFFSWADIWMFSVPQKACTTLTSMAEENISMKFLCVWWGIQKEMHFLPDTCPIGVLAWINSELEVEKRTDVLLELPPESAVFFQDHCSIGRGLREEEMEEGRLGTTYIQCKWKTALFWMHTSGKRLNGKADSGWNSWGECPKAIILKNCQW